MCMKKLLGKSGVERPSPGNWLPSDSIFWRQDVGKFEVDLLKLNVVLSELPIIFVCPVEDTGSMDPFIDAGNRAIMIAGSNPEDHQKLIDRLVVGDIAIFLVPGGNPPQALHRISKITKDSHGRLFRFKGDNNAVIDPVKVRDEHITYVCVGVLY